ncbi:hypothetical protein [Rhodohalobacter sp.]|uniref:hypothetical protein n=1 Tax=Rhodohalobacter sp. TaxID=1974210 RepID=UPI002ACD5874|nr:hypothetical protein [Rhodohalobacter sp.]MDZ7756369.1 hypothetical protein [Rhodohalobacter sp.]
MPRTLGATANLFLLIEYERQVAEGLDSDPAKRSPCWEINKFALPEISENNHNQLVKEFENRDGSSPHDVIKAMLENSDLVSADYIWFKLGEDNIRTLMDSLDVSESLIPLPFSGMYSRINPSLNDTADLWIQLCRLKRFAEEVDLYIAEQLKQRPGI